MHTSENKRPPQSIGLVTLRSFTFTYSLIYFYGRSTNLLIICFQGHEVIHIRARVAQLLIQGIQELVRVLAARRPREGEQLFPTGRRAGGIVLSLGGRWGAVQTNVRIKISTAW